VGNLGVRTLALLVPLALLTGCGTEKHAQPPGPPPAALQPPTVPARQLSWVHVIVLDGDLSTPVRGAAVRIGARTGRTGRDGVAKIRIGRHARFVVSVAKRGYESFRQRLQFRARPKVGVRVFQSKLQWPLYGATAARTQAQQFIHVRPPFRVVWSRAVGGLMEFPAVVDADVAFVSNYHGSVRAYSMHNGALVWRRDLGGMMAASPAIWGDHELVVHGMNGRVYVLNRHNGRVLWSYSTGAAIESSPFVRDGVDYFGAWNGTVYALDLRTRQLRWTYRSGYKITSSASFANGTLFIGDYGGRLLALSARRGGLRWSASVNGRIYGTPAVAAGRVFVTSSTGGSATAFSTSGRRLWSLGTGSYVYSSPAVWNGRVYVGSYNGTLYCVSASSGSVRWRYSTAGAIAGAPTVVAGVVYFSNRQHRIYGVSARTGKRLLRFHDGAFVPVSGNARRLLLHGFSRLYAVEPRRR
jgi:outer membrane protein assembly factor BamB